MQQFLFTIAAGYGAGAGAGAMVDEHTSDATGASNIVTFRTEYHAVDYWRMLIIVVSWCAAAVAAIYTSNFIAFNTKHYAVDHRRI